jgi:hypothetical protein
MSGENVIQSASMDSLAIYFRERQVKYRQLWTYSNQQGIKANKFCGDLIGVIDDATMFEVPSIFSLPSGGFHAACFS